MFGNLDLWLRLLKFGLLSCLRCLIVLVSFFEFGSIVGVLVVFCVRVLSMVFVVFLIFDWWLCYVFRMVLRIIWNDGVLLICCGGK